MAEEQGIDHAQRIDNGQRVNGNHAGPRVFGVVRQGSGEPVADATVTLADMAGRQIDVARTGADGGYRLTPATGGTYLVIGAAAAFQPVVSLVAVGDRAVRQDITLAGDGGIAGALRLSDSGRPVGDAVVTVTDVQGNIVAVTRSAADGGFRVHNLVEGTYTLVVAAEPYPPLAQTVEIPRGTTVTLTVEVAATSSITGIVVDPDDQPFAGAQVVLLDDAERTVATEITGADGSFTFEGLTGGRYALVANGYGPTATPVHIDGGATVEADLTLQPLTDEVVR
jgi:hypothetical protein